MKGRTENLRNRFINRMTKQWSVERSVFINLKPRKKWEEGLTTVKLLKIINSERKRKKEYTKGKIYDAISLINEFGSKEYGIYIISRVGWVDKENKVTEYRYFNISTFDDGKTENDRLDYKKEILNIKKENINYHVVETISEEKQIEDLHNKNKDAIGD